MNSNCKIINIIGCYGSEPAPAAAAILAAAEIVVGSSTLLQKIALPPTAATIAWQHDPSAIIPELAERSQTKNTVILASGDPLFYGIGATLQRFIPRERLHFFPAPTAFQQLFARLGQPWSSARLFSLHAKPELPFRAILQATTAAIYGDATRPAQKIAAALLDHFPAAAERSAAAGCNLGLPDEKIIRGTLAEIAADPQAAASLSVLALLPEPKAALPPLALGLPDEYYCHADNIITHPEVRAIVLSKLRLRPGVMWDLGAGSGSVGLEAAGLCPDLEVHAVEKNPERFVHLQQNIQQEGLANITPHEGPAAMWLDRLPPPDRIFIGGGSAELLTESFARLRPGGGLVVTGVTVETVSRLGSALPEYRRELLAISLSRARPLPGGGSLWHGKNPITIAVFSKPMEKQS
ncbi:MAG: precorrin-6y C5,15-methyltransferase (decarboxylating) subunit CbiE [Victivallales bacterium]|nr:precorrin-6y C5,15-methyltransferase (decarboxylating) subunit CbiE [Victivallales bacterium]